MQKVVQTQATRRRFYASISNGLSSPRSLHATAFSNSARESHTNAQALGRPIAQPVAAELWDRNYQVRKPVSVPVIKVLEFALEEVGLIAKPEK